MNKTSIVFTFLFIVSGFLSGNKIFSQVNSNYKIVTDTILVNFQNRYYFKSTNVIPNSEIIRLRDKTISRNEYKIIYSAGEFTLSDSLSYSIFDTLFVTYNSIRLNLFKEYKKRELIVKYDEKSRDSIKTIQSDSRLLSADYFFGNQLEKSGTLIRGFTVGTNKDFTLQSGLRLQLSGKLSDEIEIVAALTDENSPIQPEGNTERLDELDKVFIQIKHKNASGTFGDYDLNRRSGEFGKINRKLQGLLGEFMFDDINGYTAFASSKGKFNTNKLSGLDGVQGPYRLSGINSEKNIIIIAGSEKVFLDGEEMKRGENKDYIIDYSNSTITFTPNKLITSASRINVDFEYTDRRFERTLISSGTDLNIIDKKLSLQFQFLREGDNQDAPIDISLSEEDKNILSSAGDDRYKAVKSGVTLAQPDSLGNIKGIYEKRDTVIQGDNVTYYIYNPGSSNSIYNISFTYVGEGIGDYVKQSLGYYTYTGKGSGSYLPIVFLPLPELKQFGNLVLNYSPYDKIFISVEVAGSSYDANRFSPLNDDDNLGYARNILFRVDPQQITIGDLNFGKIGFSYKDRFTEKRFKSVDRFNEVEFERNYNTISQNTEQNEILREASLKMIPSDFITINSSYGLLKRGNLFSSSRYNNSLVVGDNKDYSVTYNLDIADAKSNSSKSFWVRQRANAFYTVWKLKPGIEFLSEKKTDKLINNNLLVSGSLKYDEFNPYVDLIAVNGFNAGFKLTFREDYLPINGILERESKSVGQSYEMNFNAIQEVNSNIKITIREKKYSDIYKKAGQLNNQTILVRSQSRFQFWQRKLNGDLYYEVSTQKTAKLEKVFVKVQKGTGQYIYLGDLNNNGIAEENEFQYSIYDGEFVLVTIPTDKLYPVIDLKTSTRWKVNLSDIFPGEGILKSIFSPLSSETYIRIEENSEEENLKKIYLLNFSSFRNDKTTIRGSEYIQQDFFIFENSSELSFRLRFNQRKSLNQFSSGIEKGYNRERSMRIRFRMVQEITNQTDIVNQLDYLGAPLSSNRNRMIESNFVTSDFSYRPDRNIEIGFILKGGRSSDYYPKNPTIINSNGQVIRFNFSFIGNGRIRVELERNELTANTTENYIPFELTSGNLIGKNYFWRANFDYRISSNLQSTASYDGRLQGGGRVINTARAEVRAYF